MPAVETGSAAKLAIASCVGLASYLGGSSAYVWTGLETSDCALEAHPDMSIEQLISVKRRIDAYEQDPNATLDLSDDELSMILEDRIAVPVRVDLDGEALRARVVLPTSVERCYAIDFAGRVVVASGVAQLEAESLSVSGMDLSWAAQHMALELHAEHMPNAAAAKLLTATREMTVEDGKAHLHLHSIRSLRER